MGNPMLEDIKELFQAFIAPQLEGIKGDIRALDTKIDTKIGAVDTKMESYRREFLAEMRGMDQTILKSKKLCPRSLSACSLRALLQLGDHPIE